MDEKVLGSQDPQPPFNTAVAEKTVYWPMANGQWAQFMIRQVRGIRQDSSLHSH